MNLSGFVISVLVPFVISPLFPGVINKTKAFFGGRKGVSLFQTYYDLIKLFRKGAVYSKTTTWIFRAGPILLFSSALSALLFLPAGSFKAPLAFQGDLVLVIYLLALGRFALAAAAIDTGSSFEGMGASREMQFSVFTELALFLALFALAAASKTFSISELLIPETGGFRNAWIIHVLAALIFFIVLLSENSRIPIDDPDTHLELTMIHEVMILDHSGPDLALILWAGAIKLWIFGILTVQTVVSMGSTGRAVQAVSAAAGIFILLISVGIVESVMARFKLRRVPGFLLGIASLAAIALGLVLLR